MIALTLAALLLAAEPKTASPATGQQFDLVCTGTIQEMRGAEKPETRHYVLDLAAKRWCKTPDCRPSEIKSVTADEIKLGESDPAASTSVLHAISRQTGGYFDSLVIPSIGVSSTAKGTCNKAPFSGFPGAKF